MTDWLAYWTLCIAEAASVAEALPQRNTQVCIEWKRFSTLKQIPSFSKGDELLFACLSCFSEPDRTSGNRSRSSTKQTSRVTFHFCFCGTDLVIFSLDFEASCRQAYILIKRINSQSLYWHLWFPKASNTVIPLSLSDKIWLLICLPAQPQAACIFPSYPHCGNSTFNWNCVSVVIKRKPFVRVEPRWFPFP
jgi:hypothetical protein